MRNFVIGLATGYVIGRMLAPASGEEIRHGLQERAIGMKDALLDRARRIEAGFIIQNDTALTHVLNDASKDDLMSVKGIGPVLANRIIRHRPYESAAKILAEEVLPIGALRALEAKLVGGAEKQETEAA